MQLKHFRREEGAVTLAQKYNLYDLCKAIFWGRSPTYGKPFVKGKSILVLQAITSLCMYVHIIYIRVCVNLDFH